MAAILEVARTGLVAVRLHPLRSAATMAAVVVVLVPYLVGMGIAKGVEDEAEASARFGADLHVAGRDFGRSAAVPLEWVPRVRTVDGVADVVPRIVGAIVLGKDRVPAVLVGLPPGRMSDYGAIVAGELPRDGGPHQLVVGSALAKKLNLTVGSMIPPFYRSERGERSAVVVGTFEPDAPLWAAHLVLATFATAAEVFDQPGHATELLVEVRPGYAEAVARQLKRMPLAARVTAREDMLALLPASARQRSGVLNLHFVLAFAVGILVVMVTSGMGLSERRREIGILKAVGWQTDQILLRAVVESLSLAATAAGTALILAWVWLRAFDGYGIAGVFLPGVAMAPEIAVPFRLAPVPALLAFVVALVVVPTGSVYSAWRAATANPRDAMR